MEHRRIQIALVGLTIAACGADGEGRESSLSGVSFGGIVTLTATTAPDETAGGVSGDVTSGGGGTGGGTSGGTSGGGTTGTSGAVDEGTGAASSGGGAKLDLGDGEEPGVPVPPEQERCRRVDLLFVVDNSTSMREEQASLIAAFPAFVQEVRLALGEPGLHVGVVTTDDYEYNEEPCAGTLGALVTRTGGEDSSDAVCGPYTSGRRYWTEEDDLAERFACAAQVGTDGSTDERPIDAALRAVGPGLAAKGACNEDFVRDDALLVLVVLTDEDEEGSDGDPPEWFNTLVALRGGIESNIVVLALTGPEQPACGADVEIGARLVAFTEMFTYGRVGRICADSYEETLLDATFAIAEACEGFVRP